ncbi:MAG: hypothetical protein CMM93_08705 [Rickettsiales bacterium]|nr:hypothetical protein [Rickettsiales bacterium]
MERKFPDISDLSIDDIWEWHDKGLDSKKLPMEVVEYIDAMDKVRNMSRRFDKYGSKANIIDYLTNVEGYSYYLANKLYNNSFEYFNTNDSVSLDAHLNWIVDMMKQNIQQGILLSKDTNDNARIGRMLRELKDVVSELGRNEDELDEILKRKPIKLYTLKPEDVGMLPIPKKKLDKLLDSYEEITEAQRTIIKEEAMLIPGNLFRDPELRNE